MPRNASSKTANKTSSKAAYRGSSKASHQDALDILAEDHKNVVKMFEQFEEMKEDEDQEAKQLLVETACAELTIHAQVEEELFYPALRDAIEETDLLDEATVEHAAAKQLITELSAMQPDDELYAAKFTVLGEYVKHHIKEEEKEIFAKAKKSELDLDELAEDIQQRKQELRDELGLSSDENMEEMDEEDEQQSKAQQRKNIH